MQVVVQQEFPAKAATKFYYHTAIGLDTAHARPLVAGDKFLGINARPVDNTNGAAGDEMVVTETGHLILVAVAGATASNASAQVKVYASDDTTFTTTATNNSLMGVIEQYDIPTGKFWVRVLSIAECAL
jgi:hypothetical protein